MNDTPVIRVEDYMTGEPVTAHPEMDACEAIGLLLKHPISGMPVVDAAGRLVGILSERDCLEAFVNAQYYESPAALVNELMSTDVVTVDPNMDILKVAELFSHTRFHHLPVLQEDRLVGEISRKDVIRAIQEICSAK